MAEKIGVYICECGPNIAEKVDIDRVVGEISSLNGVAVTERHKLLCSEEGKKFLEQSIKEHELTHLVVAACSPKQHEQTFMNVCEKAGLNPYLFQLANIREQCAWITPDKEEATQKAIRYVRAAIARVRHHIPLEKREIEANPDVLVIGGGVAGIEASQLLASKDRKVYLVEKASRLGGKAIELEKLFPDMGAGSQVIKQEIENVLNNENIEVLTDSEVEQCLGFFGNFEIKVKKRTENKERELKVGAIVVATGFELFNPKGIAQYGYGKFDDVYTALEFEQMNTSGKILLKNGKPPKSAAIIHCVGRDEKGYCSRICCLYSIKFARYLQEKVPGIKVSQFYSDLCIPGKSYQKFYEETKERGVNFIHAEEIEIDEQDGGLIIKYKNEAGKKESLPTDLVILAPAIEPATDSDKLAQLLNIPRGEEGFFTEEHEKLAPVSTSIEGIFIVGCAQGPKNIPESIVQAQAASGKILSSLVPGRKLEPEVKTAEISEAFCIGCKTCLSVCTYSAITFDEIKRISVVNEVICRGCGNCVAACPSGAANIKHFNFGQIYRELMEVLR